MTERSGSTAKVLDFLSVEGVQGVGLDRPTLGQVEGVKIGLLRVKEGPARLHAAGVEEQLDRLADLLRGNLDMGLVYEILERGV